MVQKINPHPAPGCNRSPPPLPCIFKRCHSTLVGLSTRPTPLIISKSLQFRTFWSQSKALFMIRCMLSVESGSNMFGALKVTIYVNFLNFQYIKWAIFCVFLHANGQCQVTFLLLLALVKALSRHGMPFYLEVLG